MGGLWEGPHLDHLGFAGKVRNLDFSSMSDEKTLVDFKQAHPTVIFNLTGWFGYSEDKRRNQGKEGSQEPSWKLRSQVREFER